MPRPNRMKEIEHEYGKPAEQIIIETLNEQGSVLAAANKLNISFSNLSLYIKKLNIEKRCFWAKRESA